MNRNDMEIKMNATYISSVSDYLNRIQEFYEQYPNAVPVNNPIKNAFLFRGMEDKQYQLLPSIFREMMTTLNGTKETNINKKYLAFCSEMSILENFIQDASAYISQYDTNNYIRWLELAQHYGVPTRLLDWTENALVALYFACESNKNCDAVVWMLHKNNYLKCVEIRDQNRKNQHQTNEEAIMDLLIASKNNDMNNASLYEWPIIYTPYYFDHRMSAQSSWFMSWGKNINPLEDLIEDTDYMENISSTAEVQQSGGVQNSQFIFRFFIRPSDKQRIMRQLDYIGIHAKTLFPGLDGIGKHIERAYRFNYYEACDHLLL